jgi:3-hydroxyisobutyrate dehydrogenase-like beta-hydroxyacid dehydrogenase
MSNQPNKGSTSIANTMSRPPAPAEVKKVGVIGVGAMGRPMAENLLKAGFDLYVTVHRNNKPVEALVALGAMEVADGAEMASECDLIVTMVPDAPQVEQACFGERGIVQRAKPGLIVVDMSTISPVASRQIAEKLKAKGVTMLDAPVSGGPARAQSGTLTIMAGGEPEVYERAEPVLKAMGNPVLVGENGMGEVVKMVNQIIIGVSAIGIVEAFTVGVKAGADPEKVREVLLSATSSSYLMDKWMPQSLLKNDFSIGFASELLFKDLSAALSAGKDLGVPMMATALAHQLYATVKGMGYNRDDYMVVSKLYEAASGATIGKKE